MVVVMMRRMGTGEKLRTLTRGSGTNQRFGNKSGAYKGNPTDDGDDDDDDGDDEDENSGGSDDDDGDDEDENSGGSGWPSATYAEWPWRGCLQASPFPEALSLEVSPFC